MKWKDRLARDGSVLELTDEQLDRFLATAPLGEPVAGYLMRARTRGRVRELCLALREQRPRYRTWGAHSVCVLSLLTLVVCLGIVWSILVPPLVQLIEGLCVQLPVPTRLLLCCHSWFPQGYWFAPLVLGFTLLCVRAQRKSTRPLLMNLKLAWASDPDGILPALTGLGSEERELLASAAAQERLGEALDFLLETRPEASFLAWLTALLATLSGVTVVVVLALLLPLHQLIGSLG